MPIEVPSRTPAKRKASVRLLVDEQGKAVRAGVGIVRYEEPVALSGRMPLTNER